MNSTVTCDVSSCRAMVIANVISNTLYDTSAFRACQGCSAAIFPNFPDWSSRWSSNDFVVLTGNGTDISNNPRNNTLVDCKRICLGYWDCAGFSRPKAASDTSVATCYLKMNLTATLRTYYDSIWLTWSFDNS